MIKLIKSKKGQELPGTLVDIVSIVFFIVLVLFLFLLLFLHSCSTESSNTEKLNSFSSALDLNTQLLNFLRTPIIFSEKQYATIAELAELSIYDASYEEIINNQMGIAFGNQPHSYAFMIHKGGAGRAFGNPAVLVYDVLVYGKSSSVAIPGYDFKEVEFTLIRIT